MKNNYRKKKIISKYITLADIREIHKQKGVIIMKMYIRHRGK